MDFSAGRSSCSQHGIAASRVRALAEGRRRTKIVCSGGTGRTGDAERLIKEG